MAEHQIRRLGLKGDGIADGPIFATRTLPGEIVTGEVTDGRIERPKILTPAAERVKPPCPHYNSCGGCQVMHASDDFVAGWKQDIVARALSAQGLVAEISRITTSPLHSRRRATLAGRRQKSGPVVGFHGRASHTVTDSPNCQVLRPELLAARDVCEDVTKLLGTRKGEVRVGVTVSQAGLDLDISGGRDLKDADRVELAALADRHDVARLSHEGDVIVERHPPAQLFDGIAVVPPPGAFLQATLEGEAALQRAVNWATEGARHIVDLFAGCGTLGLPLARRSQLHAVEGEAGLLAALDRAARNATGLKPVTTERRDLFRRPLLPDELARFDAAIIDPPRAGAEAQIRELAQAQIPQIAMVSCNPVSFARDTRILVDAGYVMSDLEVVDQFRWSTHVELAASLRLS